MRTVLIVLNNRQLDWKTDVDSVERKRKSTAGATSASETQYRYFNRQYTHILTTSVAVFHLRNSEKENGQENVMNN